MREKELAKKELSGEKLNQKLYDEAFDVNELKLETKHNVCFPAGTRITTDKGLKRIEDIQVGDMVLSKHESGIGEQEFKPVIRTVVHHNKEIWGLEYCIVRKSVKPDSLSDFDILNMSRKGKVFGIYATPNHPFWVKGLGWTRLDALKQGQLLEMKDKEYSAYVILANPIYQTNVPKIFAKLSFDTYLDVRECLDDINYTHSQDNPDYSFFKYAENIRDRESLNNGLMTKSPFTDSEYGEIIPSTDTLLSTVYNFEVADNHTYYISDKLWVHNDNCPTPTNADVKRRQDNGTPPIQNVRIFHSKELANEYFRQIQQQLKLRLLK